MFAPIGTSQEIVGCQTRESIRALESSELRKRQSAAGVEAWPGSADDMNRLLQSKTLRHAEIMRGAKLK